LRLSRCCFAEKQVHAAPAIFFGKTTSFVPFKFSQQLRIIAISNFKSLKSPDPDAYALVFKSLVAIAAYIIHPEYLQYIFYAGKQFIVIVAFIHYESVASPNQVNIKRFNERDLIGKETIKMMLNIKRAVKTGSGAPFIIRC
jgi:hypothetical protein